MFLPLYVCVDVSCSFWNSSELNSGVWSPRLSFLLGPCPANSKSFFLRLHPLWHPFTSTVLGGLCPCPKIMVAGTVSILPKGASGPGEGMKHAQPFGCRVSSLVIAILEFQWAREIPKVFIKNVRFQAAALERSSVLGEGLGCLKTTF